MFQIRSHMSTERATYQRPRVAGRATSTGYAIVSLWKRDLFADSHILHFHLHSHTYSFSFLSVGPWRSNISLWATCDVSEDPQLYLKVTIFFRYYCLQIVDFVHFTGIIFCDLIGGTALIIIHGLNSCVYLNFALLCRSAKISNISTRKK